MPSTDASPTMTSVPDGAPMDVDGATADPKAAEEKKAEGNKHYVAKNYKEAIQFYSEAIELNPAASYYGNRSAAYMMIDNYKKALEDAQTSIKLDPTFAKGYLREGKCHIALGNSQAALLSLQKAKEHDQSAGAVMAEFHDWETSLPPSSQELLDEMRELAAEGMNKIMGAIGTEIEKDFRERKEREEKGRMPTGKIEGGKSKWVQNARALSEYERKAGQCMENRDFRQVVFCMDRASKIAPACVAYKIKQAECYALLGRYEEAHNLASDILQRDSMNADAVYVRALCMYYDDNIDKAVRFFIHALKLSPDLEKAKFTLRKAKLLAAKKAEGNEAYKANKLDEAYKLYGEALKIDENNRKTNAKLYYNKALAASKLNKTIEAIGDCTCAIELDENYLKAYLKRGHLYSDTDQFEESVRDYKKVFQMEKTREHKRLVDDAEHKLKLSKRKDYYKILGVTKSASDDELKKAYRKRALLHHPDRHSHDTEDVQKQNEMKFKEIGEAYAVLSDQKKRDRYDRGEDIDGPSMGDFDASNIFQMFFGGGGGGPGFQFSTGHPGEFQFQFG